MLENNFRFAFAALALATAVPTGAQTLEELDRLSDETADEASGIEAARQQIERGELLQALATLERVLTQFPKSDEARFNHAILLCWIDDPQGGLVEFRRLEEDDYAEGALKQAIADCRLAAEERKP